MRAALAFLLVLAVGAGGAALASPIGESVTFPVRQILPLLLLGAASVQVIPQDEYQRQFPVMVIRLHGVEKLPSDDPYKKALGEAITRLNVHRSITAQVWPHNRGRVGRLHGYVGEKWTDLNGVLVREGAAVARPEGNSVPYARDQEAARLARIGRHAYRGALAAFWANSTPLYAATLTPSPGVSLPFAVARVSVTRIEAGYLTPRGVVLLPMDGAKLGYSVVGVRAQGTELEIVTGGLGGPARTMRWRWDGTAYQYYRP